MYSHTQYPCTARYTINDIKLVWYNLISNCRGCICQNLQIKQCYKGVVPSHIALCSGKCWYSTGQPLSGEQTAWCVSLRSYSAVTGCVGWHGLLLVFKEVIWHLCACMLTHCASIQRYLKIIVCQDRGRAQANVPLQGYLNYSFSWHLHGNNHANIYFYLKKIQLEAWIAFYSD